MHTSEDNPLTIVVHEHYSQLVKLLATFPVSKLLLTFQSTVYENLQVINTDIFEQRLKLHAEEKWKALVESKPKLRTYKLFKHKLEPEIYLTKNISRSKRSVFAQYRCGILPLNIEVGRFRGQPENERLCTLCPLQSTESELHFLF